MRATTLFAVCSIVMILITHVSYDVCLVRAYAGRFDNWGIFSVIGDERALSSKRHIVAVCRKPDGRLAWRCTVPGHKADKLCKCKLRVGEYVGLCGEDDDSVTLDDLDAGWCDDHIDEEPLQHGEKELLSNKSALPSERTRCDTHDGFTSPLYHVG